MDNKFPFLHWTTGNVILLVGLMCLVLLGVNTGYLNFTSQVRDRNLEATQNLIKAIDRSDERDDNQTKLILNKTLAKSNQNYEQLQKNFNILSAQLNASNFFIKSLSDNFGEQSNYTQRENAHRALVEANQSEGLHNHDILLGKLNNILKILNQSQTK